MVPSLWEEEEEEEEVPVGGGGKLTLGKSRIFGKAGKLA